MKSGNIILEVAEPDQIECTATSVEPVPSSAAVLLEASDFERLLEHAAEVLSLRERIAALGCS